MGLDARGGISLAQLLIYIPILIVSAVLVRRHGFKRQAGWIFLLILSIVRIVGAACHIAAEQSSDPSTTLITVFSILESAGLSPLMLATIGFLSTVAQGVFENPRVYRALHLLGILASVALILTIVGGVDVGNAKTQDDLNTGTKYRHIGVILFLVLFIIVALVHGVLWSLKHKILTHRRVLLVGISAVLPFLFIRTVYAVLSGFSPAAIPPNTPEHNSLSKFNSLTGSWEIYMVMSAIAELLTVITYLLVGARVPLSQEYEQTYNMGGVQEGYHSDQALQPSYYKP